MLITVTLGVRPADSYMRYMRYMAQCPHSAPIAGGEPGEQHAPAMGPALGCFIS